MWYLIYAVIPSGKAGEVIRLAEQEGSQGGTVIHGKGIGRKPKRFLNFEVEPMREIIWITVEIAINQFTEDKSMVLENLELILKNTLDSEYDKPIEDIEEKLHELQKELIGLHDDRRYDQIVDELEALRKLKQDILIENASREEKRERISDIKAFLKTSHVEIEEYEEALVYRLVSKVIIHDEKVEVSLKTGEVITVNQ